MVLVYTGRQTNSPSETSYEARDHDGVRVTVKATSEALTDHGEMAVREVANDKYDAGSFTEINCVRIVTVQTNDFAEPPDA